MGLSIPKIQTALGWISPVRVLPTQNRTEASRLKRKCCTHLLTRCPREKTISLLGLPGRLRSRVVLMFEVAGGLCCATVHTTGTPSMLGADACYASICCSSWDITLKVHLTQ